MISGPLPKGALLLASSDLDWLEALQLELEAEGEKTVASSNLSSAIQALEGGELDVRAIIVDARMRRLGRAGTQPMGPVTFARAIRAAGSDQPILFLTAVPFEEGVLFAKQFPPSQVIFDEHLQSDRLRLIHDALALRQGRAQPPTDASVEIEIGNGRLTLIVRHEPDGMPSRRELDWSGRTRLANLASLFRDWTPYSRDSKGLRETDRWQQTLEFAGKSLLDEIPVTPLVQELVRDIADQENIHFRFNISAREEDQDLVHVPFELIQHPDRTSFMRQVSPVARRLLLEPEQMLRQIGNPGNTNLGSVLCVLSDVEGVFSVPQCTFGKKERVTFGRLKGLKEEWQAIETAYNCPGRSCRKLELTSGDPIGALQKEMKAGYDIIHYSGHSIRSDDGENVFLVLPERSDSNQLQPFAIKDFADLVSQAGARLVILSSCESSSVEAIIRLAQFGISTVIGFRWEVLDSGAKVFTSQLHQGLAAEQPIGRAFVRAMKDLMRRDLNTPTFASPVLMVQRDSWV